MVIRGNLFLRVISVVNRVFFSVQFMLYILVSDFMLKVMFCIF